MNFSKLGKSSGNRWVSAIVRVLAVTATLAGFFLSYAVSAASSVAAPPAGLATSVALQDHTWTEVRDAVSSGTTTIIIPIGGTEQSGPYLALGKHNARADALARRIAQDLGHTLVAPVIAYVPEGGTAPLTSHMRFTGTITVPDAVFEQLLQSAAESFRVHGFRNVVLLGDHGGYQKDLARVVARLNKAWAGTGAHAWVPAAYYAASSEGFDALLRERGYRQDEIGTHAGLADAALLMAVEPSMVRADAMHLPSARHGAIDGVYGGDSRRATAALGQLGINLIVSRTVAQIRADIGGASVTSR
jgi:creatinine amidohydrolase